MTPLLDTQTLERSSVVANACMNRERGLAGANSYAKDLGFNPADFLEARLHAQEMVGWLDLCCGAGNALVQAARQLQADSVRVTLRGVDLVSLFSPFPPEWDFLRLTEASLSAWEPDRAFNLITCVHGLHYVGDKIALLERAASWLTADGLFAVHLDLANVCFADGQKGSAVFRRRLRAAGFTYTARQHMLSRRGNVPVHLGFHYLGADDKAGPNFSGQPGVNLNGCNSPKLASLPVLSESALRRNPHPVFQIPRGLPRGASFLFTRAQTGPLNLMG